MKKALIIKTHKYYGMFCSLSRELKRRVLGRAQQVSQVFTIKDRVESLLNTYEYNFIRLRYTYQSYESFSQEEFKEYGNLYAELGFPDGEAEFEYYPEELRGLIIGLREYVETNIAKK